jgi:hypothetical protein
VSQRLTQETKRGGLTDAMQDAVDKVQEGTADEELIKTLAAYSKTHLRKLQTQSDWSHKKKSLDILEPAASGPAVVNLLKTIGSKLVKTRQKELAAVPLNQLSRENIAFTTEGKTARAHEKAAASSTDAADDFDLEHAFAKALRRINKKMSTKKQYQAKWERPDAPVNANQTGTPPMILLTADSTAASTWEAMKARVVDFNLDPKGITLVAGSPPWGIRGAANAANQKKRRAAKKRNEKNDSEGSDESDADDAEPAYHDVELTQVQVSMMVLARA